MLLLTAARMHDSRMTSRCNREEVVEEVVTIPGEVVVKRKSYYCASKRRVEEGLARGSPSGWGRTLKFEFL